MFDTEIVSFRTRFTKEDIQGIWVEYFTKWDLIKHCQQSFILDQIVSVKAHFNELKKFKSFFITEWTISFKNMRENVKARFKFTNL